VNGTSYSGERRGSEDTNTNPDYGNGLTSEDT